MALKEIAQIRQFEINAAVVFRLGEELITDVVQALVELVKNSYDADATWVKVSIDTRGRNTWGREYADASGSIVVEDDGHGMDEPTIRRGWLTIANSPKRELKEAGGTSPLGRTPIGDKGLGRLGSQRLAENVEIVTRHTENPTTEFYVAFSWSDFRETPNLRDVPLTWRQSSISGKKAGTKLILSDLRELEIWQDEAYLQNLQMELSGMISPFQEARDFQVHLEVDGKRLELAEIAQKLRETALLRYDFRFDGGVFFISGVARLNYLQPNNREDQQLLNQLCRRDRGKELYEFLASRTGKGRPPTFDFAKRPEWFVEFGAKRKLDDLDGVRRVDGSPFNPGTFRGEVDAVSLDISDATNHEFGRQSDYRRLVRDLAGIRVYRDGFGVRVGEDWLGLGKQWTRGSSYYGLRPGNVLGFVAISARDNHNLVETTSREGFQVTPHYENFIGLLSEFVQFAGDFQEFLRRGVLQFLNEHKDRNSGVEPDDAHSEVTQRIDDVAARLSSEKGKVQRQAGSLRMAAKAASEILVESRNDLDKTGVAGASTSDALTRIDLGLTKVSTAAADTENVLDEVSAVLDQASELKSLRKVLDRRWFTLQDEVSALYESISLGLTAEALSHEIHNIADRLARRSAALLRELDRVVRKASMITYVEHVRSSVAAMRKQLAHLTPSLRYLREQRERIEVLPWARDFATFYNQRLEPKAIKMDIVQGRARELAVNMNKGKLTQVFDNLVLNAEYWLKDAIRAGLLKNGVITIDVHAPLVRVKDNGRGVDLGVEESLFEPFVTMKRTGEGRGLGLFVSRQLLDSESCGILLLPERNDNGRRYAFELDFSGAACE